jgi:hypothetical protein
MRSLRYLHQNRAGGPQNFWHLRQNDFCNSIGAKRPFIDHSIFVVLMSPVKVTAPAIIALLPVFLGLGDGLTVTDLNDFNGPAQTTNLGVRSSNLFGRAIYQ